ncbi:hydrogenase 3 maturation endopeptidase HyCI [Thermococcus profundus]|uniref:Hydrogenase 3 maturation endopeptidase HyCI n=1 Tax=Thermococcus profundus TaxID=49899 RepID=A0A2Z2M7X7_THEPR|nr:hydrogenase 3 maturation endopeptidase HyCI [Thermococcus profundus]ASJ02367.1 hydrogenase 3 maturation endopeptidase HyCI [Thermococcus profundus]
MNALEEVFSGKKRIVICGIGNEVRGDDAFGVLVAERLKELVKNPDVLVLNCGEMPESHVGKITDFRPDLVVFVDAIHFEGEVGEIIIADPLKTLGEVISTHKLPLRLVASYLKEQTGSDAVLIGCQPGSTGLFEEPSELIRERAEKLARLLAEILR